MGLIRKVLNNPYPLRTITRKTICKLSLGTYKQRFMLGLVERPYYGYIIYHAAVLAKKLGYDHISVLEFGVSTGYGLLNLEYHAKNIQDWLEIEIELYGFDTGEGMPEPIDHRDLPYAWRKSWYKMDLDQLISKLNKAKLVLGNVNETTMDFFKNYNPAPIGAIAFDLDYYSSTFDAFKIFTSQVKNFLPRIFCYFDDIIGDERSLFTEHTGERLAISEFNEKSDGIKIGYPYHLICREKVVESWHHKIRSIHFFKHEKYNNFIE